MRAADQKAGNVLKVHHKVRIDCLFFEMRFLQCLRVMNTTRFSSFFFFLFHLPSLIFVLLQAVASGKEAQQLKGIGDKIGAKIDEILATGGLQKLDETRQDETLKALTELSSVHGIGPKMAKTLMDEHKVTSIVGLTKFDQDNPTVLNAAQKLGLQYHFDLLQKIPRADVAKIVTLVTDVVLGLDHQYEIIACGSYRRGAAGSNTPRLLFDSAGLCFWRCLAECVCVCVCVCVALTMVIVFASSESGDCDLIVSHPSLTMVGTNPSPGEKVKSKPHVDAIVKALEKNNFIIGTLAQGPTQFLGIVRLPANQAVASASLASSCSPSPSAATSTSSSALPHASTGQSPVATDATTPSPSAPAPARKFVIPSMKKVDLTSTTAAPKLSVFRSSGDAPAPAPAAAEDHSSIPTASMTDTPAKPVPSSSSTRSSHVADSAAAAAPSVKRRFARRLDIRVVPWQSRACATLYFTGNAIFNKNLRQDATELGVLLFCVCVCFSR